MDVVSLFPVPNPEYPSNYWHLIGDNLIEAEGSTYRMSSSYGPDNSFSISVKQTQTSSFPTGTTVTGTSQGWSSVEQGVIDTAYDSEGNLLKLTNTTVPNALSDSPPFGWTAISASTPGNVGVIHEDNNVLEYFQTNPYLGGWHMQTFQIYDNLQPDTSDLEIGCDGVPHITYSTYERELMVVDFDIISGQWEETILEANLSLQHSPTVATLAKTGDGTVGAAWVSDGDLKYAYKEGNDPWIVTTVLGGGNYDNAPISYQNPGLVYDTAGLPIISYITNARYVSIAYDPAMVPEPSTILLLVSGLIALAYYRKRGK